MNRVWEIIEKRKNATGGMTGYKRMSAMKGGMSGRKDGSYDEGVKDGLCAALDILEEHLKDLE